MPRNKFDKTPSRMFVLLNGSAIGKSREELGTIIGKGAQTASERLKNPDTLTLGELKRLARKLHIPVEDIRAAIEL